MFKIQYRIFCFVVIRIWDYHSPIKKTKNLLSIIECMPLFQHSNAKRTNGGCQELRIGFPAEIIVSSVHSRFSLHTQCVLSIWRQKPDWISGSRSSNSSTASDQFSSFSNNNSMFESHSHERCLAALVAFGKMHINKRTKEDTVSNTSTYAWDALVYATLNELYTEGTATYDWIFTFQSIIQDIRSRVSNHSKARLS